MNQRWSFHQIYSIPLNSDNHKSLWIEQSLTIFQIFVAGPYKFNIQSISLLFKWCPQLSNLYTWLLSSLLTTFLAHLARRAKLAFLITLRPSSSVVVIFYKNLLLWNYWAKFNQTWLQSSLGYLVLKNVFSDPANQPRWPHVKK